MKISIVGNGRFGKVLYRLLKDDFSVRLFGRHDAIKQIYDSKIIFFAVPISSFGAVIKTHKKYFKDHLLIDVLSVKIHPKKILEKYLENTKIQALLTHPMFGPDSSKNGFAGLPIVVDRFKTKQKTYKFWKKYFTEKGLRVVEMTAEEHDRLAAKSQGLTHFIGRLLGEVEFNSTAIDTLGAQKLQEVKNQTCHDTWQLFLDLQNFNPFTKKVRLKIGAAYDKLYDRLLPKRISHKYLIFGIQGGKGSFNEEALYDYAKNKHIKRFKIKYLYTTEKVLSNLHQGNIDFGLFAIQNAVGGVVEESTHAMARHKFKIVSEFSILIRHFLMKRKDIDLKSIKTIIAHPQVFKQCQDTLKNKYASYKLISGTGDFVDTARAAWAIAHTKLPKNFAVLGPKSLAQMFDFDIVAGNLQDSTNNLTTFFMVKR